MKPPKTLEDILSCRDEKGAVLVVSIWILIILVLLAMSVGRRTSIELKLLRHHLHRTQAFYLAKAGLERIYSEKKADENEYDALNEGWSNKRKAGNEPEFNDFALGNGKFTVKYEYRESLDKEPVTLYGMQDEQSKLSINKMLNDDQSVNDAAQTEFIQLLGILGMSASEEAEALTDKFIDWIDKDNKPRPKGKEDYADKGITPKNKPLDRLEELLMIDGFSPDIVGKLVNYATIYGDDGRININSAPKEVLMALGLSEESAKNILEERYGADGQIATKDDNYIEAIDGIDSLLTEEDRESGNLALIKQRLIVSSSVYRVKSYGTVYNVTKEITSVVEMKSNEGPKQLYWYED